MRSSVGPTNMGIGNERGPGDVESRLRAYVRTYKSLKLSVLPRINFVGAQTEGQGE